ncbi:sensor histidine kinase [Cellulosilyticum sp. I15G10I2]|uniref:sensor histidine kinase n=1 Tax=Cellulosilyticum sp. I15G10I2 TaxID=1892843 RepID=UPI0009F386DD|nr:sensor histidine kinase [Cellulosilyticum sp. I15G10I2]
MLIELSQNLFNKLGIIVLAAFMLSKSDFFKHYLLKEKLALRDKLLFSLIFGLVGIIGTYWGVPVNDAIANSRSIGVVVAGLFGGPAIGIGAGLIAGIHRMVIPAGRFTAIACGISTILGGVIAGYFKRYVDAKPNKWLWGFIIAAWIETIQMLVILLISRPFEQALNLVQLIFLPMTFINALGTAAFILLIQQIYEENERAGAVKAQLALSIATNTLPILRNGLNKKSCKTAAKIICDATGVDAVAFTNTEIILAHIGVGDDHHKSGSAIRTSITQKAIDQKQYMIAQDKVSIECENPSCKLKAAIVVPLLMKDNIIGTLKLYKCLENSITSSDIELAKGLGHLFSTQLELSQIFYQKELLNKAELRALQAQIQPHFLFNALNTIVSFCRTDALKARELLMQLSYYLRTSFKTTGEFIPLAQEFKHIESYLSIEQARFSERLEVVLDVEADIECQVPPLILQPIVENALKHGLMATKKGGRLEIHAYKKEETVYVKIKDNGIGMSEEQIQAILKGNDLDSGIGIRNVNNRLKSIYGTSLVIESQPSFGTCITIIFPQGGQIDDQSHSGR